MMVVQFPNTRFFFERTGVVKHEGVWHYFRWDTPRPVFDDPEGWIEVVW